MQLRSLSAARVPTNGPPRRTRLLRREIAALLAIKALLLYGIWCAFFSDPVLPKMTEGMDPARVANAIVATPPAARP